MHVLAHIGSRLLAPRPNVNIDHAARTRKSSPCSGDLNLGAALSSSDRSAFEVYDDATFGQDVLDIVQDRSAVMGCLLISAIGALRWKRADRQAGAFDALVLIHPIP